jgi:tight adherence protein C
MNQATFAGIQILSGIACVPCTAVLFNAFDPLLAALSFAGGILLPYAYLKAKVREKRTGIFRQIPDVLDLLALMMEAGIDFNTAMRRIIASDRGPLISELALVQRQIELGKSRADSYASLAERIDFMPLTNVVNAFLLSFSSGASLAPALTTLSEQFRVERMQLAEKSANETPVKLLLPLVTLIFPTIFIILFGPLLLSFLGEGF